MDLRSAWPFWLIRNGLPASYPLLTENRRCDVVVIGAGVSGALAAWHLTEAGFATIVLDRRDVAMGSTAASTGLLQYEIDVPLHRLARRIGPERAARCYLRCREALKALERLVRHLPLSCGFEAKHSLYLARDSTHLVRLRREFQARREAGLAVEWWTRRQLARRSSLPYPAAILSRDAAQVDAYLLTHGLLAAASRRGAQIYDRSAVTRTRFLSRGVELRTQTGAQVRARHLVVATGYEADSFLPEKVTALHSTYAIVSEPVTHFTGWPAERSLLWETADPYVYLRTTSDQRIVIGGYDEPFRDPEARDRLLEAKAAALTRRCRQLFPAIAFERAYAWAGTFASTRDGLPFIGRHPDVPHTWFALGYGGNGITFSLIAAELIRDHLLGHPDPDHRLFGFERTPDPKP